MSLCVGVCVCVCVCVSRIGAHTVHPITIKLSPVVVNMPTAVLEIKKNKNYTSWSTRWCHFPKGARTVRPTAIKLAQVILTMLAVVFKI